MSKQSTKANEGRKPEASEATISALLEETEQALQATRKVVAILEQKLLAEQRANVALQVRLMQYEGGEQ